MNVATWLAFDPDALEAQAQSMPIEAYLRELTRLKELSKKDPRDGGLHFALAIMYCRDKMKSGGLAVKHLKKAHKINPKSEKVLKFLCELLFLEQRKYSDALSYFRKWSVIRKDSASILVQMALCQMHLDKIKDALQLIERAEKIAPFDHELISAKADIYSKVGDEENALKALQAGFEKQKSFDIAARLVGMPNFDPDEAQLDELCEIAKGELGQDGQKNGEILHFFASVGLAYEKKKIYDKAFERFFESNSAARRRLDRDKNLAAFGNVRETFTKEYMDRHKQDFHEDERPIFIVGMPRSGTTLTESILAGHPSIIDNGELSLMHGRLINMGLRNKPDALLADKLPNFKSLMGKVNRGFFKKYGESYLEESGFQTSVDKYQVDKLPHNFLVVGLIAMVFPNAKIIHCRRNPIDGALSCYKASFSEFHDYCSDLEFLGLYYRQYWELMKYWRELLPGKMFEVFYEDTVANTELVARRMIDHIGLEWDDGCLDHTKSKKTVKTASQWQVRQPIYTSSVEKWRNYEEQLQPMIRAMGSCVEEYAAELEDLSKNS